MVAKGLERGKNRHVLRQFRPVVWPRDLKEARTQNRHVIREKRHVLRHIRHVAWPRDSKEARVQNRHVVR